MSAILLKALKKSWFILLSLFSIFFILDFLLPDTLKTDIMRFKGSQIEYWVPCTGGGTSLCYPVSISKLKPHQDVFVRRSSFIDVCFVTVIEKQAHNKGISCEGVPRGRHKTR